METNDKGKVEMTPDEIKNLIADALKVNTDEIVKKFKLDEPTPAPSPIISAPVIEVKQSRISEAPNYVKFFAKIGSYLDPDWAKATYGQDVVKELTGDSGEGDKLVPTAFGTEVIGKIETYSASTFCTNYAMTSDVMTLRAENASPLVYQVGQSTAPTEAAPTFTNPSLAAKAFAGMLVMTKEFYKDNNVNYYNRLVQKFAEALAAKRDLEIFVGSAFTGIAGSSTPQTTTITGSSIGNIKYNDIVDCANSLSDGAKGKNPKWYMHRTSYAKCLEITDTQNRPIITDPFNANQRSMLGYPVYLSEQITTTDAASTAFIFFGDLQWVAFGTRDPLEIKLFDTGTFNSINIGEERGVCLFADERWGLVVCLPGNLAMIKTGA